MDAIEGVPVFEDSTNIEGMPRQTEHEEYRRNLVVGKENAPDELHTGLWPIEFGTSGVAIVGWYGENNFLAPQDGDQHLAIDIAGFEGTPVFAPEDGYVVYADHKPGWHNTQRITGHMSDLMFLTESGIAYKMVHLAKSDLPEQVREILGVNGKPHFIQKGDQISTLARWPNDMQWMRENGILKTIPKMLLQHYANKNQPFGPHLHLEAYNYGDGRVVDSMGIPEIFSYSGLTRSEIRFNPLLSLVKLSSADLGEV